MAHVIRFDLASGSVSARKRTAQGGLVADANLTRAGVFTYRMPDGTTRRELRHPDEVFHPDSLASYSYAPVTIDHPGRVTPENWKGVTVGHVAQGVQREGKFARGELHIQDAKAIEHAESGKVTEVSCGYQCDIEDTSGTYDGQDYDVAQKNIRINHVALGPKGWGRMGPEVKLHLDSGCAVSGEEEREDVDNIQNTSPKKASSIAAKASKKAIDSKSAARHVSAAATHAAAAAIARANGDGERAAHHEKMSKAHDEAARAGGDWDESKHPRDEAGKFGSDGADDRGDYIRDDHTGDTMTPEEKAALEKAQAEAAKAASDLEKARQDAIDAKTETEKALAKSRADAAELAKLRAENELLKLQAERARNEGTIAAEAAKADTAIERRVEEMIRLRSDARLVFANAQDPEGKAYKYEGKSPDQIRREVLAQLEPKLKLDEIDAIPDAKAKSAALAYVYDAAIARKREVDAAREEAAKAAASERRADDGSSGSDDDDDGPVDAEKARKAMIAKKKGAWKNNGKTATSKP